MATNVFACIPAVLVPFFIKTQCIVGSPDKANNSGMFHIYLIPLLKLLYFSCKNYTEKQRDRQKQIHTIQGQVTTLQITFTYNRKSFLEKC